MSAVAAAPATPKSVSAPPTPEAVVAEEAVAQEEEEVPIKVKASRKRKERKERYPGIKVPRSAYNYYFANAKKADPTAKLGDIAAQWKTVSAEQRAELDKLVQEDKARFEREATAAGYDITPKRAKKNPNARPLTAAFMFMTERAAEVCEKEGVARKEAMQVLGQRWKALADDDELKLRYLATAKENMDKWKAQQAAAKKEDDASSDGTASASPSEEA